MAIEGELPNVGVYGVLNDKGYIHTEAHWLSIAEVMKGSHHNGMRHIVNWGQLVQWDGTEWKKIVDAGTI